jgi:hypothetical protein
MIRYSLSYRYNKMMKNPMMIHVVAEVVIVGSITLFLMKKSRQAQTRINYLEEQLQESNKKISSLQKHVDGIYQMIEALGEVNSPYPKRNGDSKSFASTSGTRNRSKLNAKSIPDEEEKSDDDVHHHHHSHSHHQHHHHQNKKMERGTPLQSSSTPLKMSSGIFPMEAIFNMMGGGLSQQPPVQAEVIEEPSVTVEEDDSDIKEELEILNNVGSQNKNE